MSDKAIAVAGLVVFLVLATCPFWYARVAGGGPPVPDLGPGESVVNCVLDPGTDDQEEMTDEDRIEWMTANHMDQLDRWRNDVVRGAGKKEECTITVTEVLPSGEKREKEYAKSLTKTCLQCHTMEVESSRKRSCTQCHNYANVEPRCMDCHVEPKGTEP